MGCVSQGGCLGPKRRQRDVYAQLIDNIHEEARKMQFSDNLNIYNAIRQKILKKGYLRKLLDNLTSHRANISDSLSYNLRLTTQSNHIQSKYAGLIILNQIVNNLYQKKSSEIAFTEQRTLMKTTTSNKILISSQKEKPVASFTIDLRTQVQYFRLITHLLQNEGRMYPKTLQSIIKFSMTKKEPFGCKSEVQRVLQLIMKKLQSGKSVNQSAGAYLALIEQLRQSNQDQIDYESVLLTFIKLCLSRQNQVQIYQGAEMSLQYKYQQILRVLIKRCISSSKLSSIYRAIFTIYDQDRFSGPRVLFMQGLIFKIIKENDLHSPVIRGAFIYMLQYLSVTISNRDKSMTYRSSRAEEFPGTRFAKIMDKGGRLRAFQTLRRWAQKEYYNLEQYISFSSSALVAAFTINLSFQRQYAREVMKEFLRLTEPIDAKYTLILVNLLMQQIKFQTNNDVLRLTLIALVREVISQRGLIQKNKKNNSFIYFIIMDGTFSKQSRLQLIQLMGFIAKRIPSQLFVVTDMNNSHFSQNLCEFMHSIYEGMLFPGNDTRPNKKAEDDDILFRYQFANSAISFLKCLSQKGAYPFILCYISSIIGSINQSVLQNKTSLYFLMYVLYSAMHLLNSKQKMPDKMVAVNFKISPSLKSQEIKPQIQSVIDNLVGNRGENFQRLISSMQTTCEQLREFIMITSNEYSQANLYFSDYFRGKLRKDSVYVQNSKNQFRRESFNQSNLQSSLNRSKMDDDLSFKDVIDRIMDI